VPLGKITVKPNAAPDPGAPSPIGEGFLYAGRLEVVKGIKLLLEAWRQSQVSKATTLTIVGDGPERRAVQEAVRVDPSIRYLGSVSPEEVGRLLDNCAVRVIPSLCFEGFPQAVVETFARGRPVISTSVGANSSVVSMGVGWPCSTTAAPDLAETIRRSFENRDAVRTRGIAARELYEASYLPDKVTSSLLRIYDGLESDTRTGTVTSGSDASS
jgi:glycosyltransferase involved in cell wall biosynthesis